VIEIAGLRVLDVAAGPQRRGRDFGIHVVGDADDLEIGPRRLFR